MNSPLYEKFKTERIIKQLNMQRDIIRLKPH